MAEQNGHVLPRENTAAPLLIDASLAARPPAKLLVVANDSSIKALTSTLVEEGITCEFATSVAEIPPILDSYPYWIALFDAEGTRERATEIQNLLRRDHPLPTLILAPHDELNKYLLDPLRDPRDECAAKPIHADELVHRVKAMMYRSGYRPTRSSSHVAGEVASAPHGKLVTISHAKGGVGASTVAVNVAVGLARAYHARTLLVDADLWYGDMALLLDVEPSRSLLNAAAAWTGTEFDMEALANIPLMHRSGVAVLPRPQEPTTVEQLDMSLVSTAVAAYAKIFDFVIVDTAASLGELPLQLLDIAEQIVLVATSDVSALHNARRFLDLGEQLGYLKRTLLVVNRADTGVSMDLVQRHLNLTPAATLPSAGRLVVDAANRGSPVLMSDSDHEFARNLKQVVELIAGRPVPKTTTPSTKSPASWVERLGLARRTERQAG
jgi:pilus assembly protein CpaE